MGAFYDFRRRCYDLVRRNRLLHSCKHLVLDWRRTPAQPPRKKMVLARAYAVGALRPMHYVGGMRQQSARHSSVVICAATHRLLKRFARTANSLAVRSAFATGCVTHPRRPRESHKLASVSASRLWQRESTSVCGA